MPTFNGPFDAVKVFSVTKFRDRRALGEEITEWIASHPELRALGCVVTQSSDSEFHCLTLTLFLEALTAVPKGGTRWKK